MATFGKLHLSGSTGGTPIKITQTATAGTTLHTTGTSASVIDEVWVYAGNTSATAVTLTIEYGGTTNPDNQIILSIAGQSGLVLVLPGLTLSGDGTSGRVVRAFASTANVITVTGFVNRIS